MSLAVYTAEKINHKSGLNIRKLMKMIEKIFLKILTSHKTGTVSIAVECGVKMSFRVNIIQTEK